ncbi:FlgO family outer membrane protein [Glaciecola sp. 1036]|uniref:FlgO family outer membrane protein n=1 Tax=Alteromonadaceae TaxID=72275 RepID=UPI003D0441C0
MKNHLQSFINFIVSILCVLVLLSLTACDSLPMSRKESHVVEQKVVLGNTELYTHELAMELFAQMTPDRQFRYAVAGFVPVTSLKTNLDHQGPLMLLGHQLEQGLTTEAVRLGFIAQDFKAANSLILSEYSDRALSRDLAHLRNSQNIDFYITGTITEQESGAIVNARIINVRNKDVIAAATKYFPAELFWQREQVTTRNGMLYRTDKPLKTSRSAGDDE